jgi:site-specific DNA recombinase
MARSRQHLRPVPKDSAQQVRCAIYTRKSTDENLDTDFNSLDAQRESAEDYIRAQQHEGWVALPERYDDGAYSGATLERPALRHLMDDVCTGRIDAIVVYKIDRLSRSLLDFARLIEELEQHHVSLVSVTQQMDTSTSLGRLNLHMVLSFAQYEREVIAERIRDKMGAARRRGKYQGGVPPLGYDVDRPNKRLVVNDEEAVLVRYIFRRYLQLGSTVALLKELAAEGHLTKAWVTQKGKQRPGRPWNKAHIYRLLGNPVCIGKVSHKGEIFEGEHEGIIEQALWDEVQEKLKGNHRARGNESRSQTPALLKGILRCGSCGASMGVTFTKQHGRQYRYYLCHQANRQGYHACPVKTVSAGIIEGAVIGLLKDVFRSPEMVARTLQAVQAREAEEKARLDADKQRIEGELAQVRAAAIPLVENLKQGKSAFVREELDGLEARRAELECGLVEVSAELSQLTHEPVSRRDLVAELTTLDNVWDNLFPGEQRRIVRLLVNEVVIHPDSIEIALAAFGVRSLVHEMQGKDGAMPEGCTIDRMADGTAVLRLPMRFKKRGGRKEIVLPEGHGSTPTYSPEQRKLLLTLARAHRWKELLESGTYPTVKALAAALNLDRSYVAKLLNLTLLAPDIIDAAVGGNEPAGLTIARLREGVPVSWNEQRERFQDS